MDDALITKKELLELTGISYGALYRWKRMKLLPDQWFIRRSTYTGHETFFPREKVLARVREIQELKESMSLEEIVRQFSPGPPGEVTLSPAEAISLGIAPAPIVNQYLSAREAEALDFQKALELSIFSELLQGGQLSRDEALELAEAAADPGDVDEPVVYLLRKYGVSICLTAGEMQKIKFDRQATLVCSLAVNDKKAALSALLKQKGVSL